MSLRQILTFAVSLSILIATGVSAQRVIPSALLTIEPRRRRITVPPLSRLRTALLAEIRFAEITEHTHVA